MKLTNEDYDIPRAVQLMAEDIRFIGPSIQCNSKTEYEALLNQFLAHHSGWKKHLAFEKGNEVCFIEDIYITTPQGESITLSLAEWLTVEDEKITQHKVFYDPAEFNRAFQVN